MFYNVPVFRADISGGLSPEKTDFTTSSHWLPVALHLGVGVLWICHPSTVTCQHYGHHTGLVQAAILLRLQGCRFPVMFWRDRLTASILVFWLLQSFYPLFWDVGARHPGVTYSLHVDKLWISIMVSICYKKKLLWRGLRATLIYGHRASKMQIETILI